MSKEEARLTGIRILNEEIAGEGRALRYLGVFIFVLVLVAFGAAMLMRNAENVIVFLILGILECCFEINSDERKRRRQNRKLIRAFENGTYEGSYVAFLRKYQEDTKENQKKLQQYMKKKEDNPSK